MANSKSAAIASLACIAGAIAVVALVIALSKPEVVKEKFGGTNPDIPSSYLRWGAGFGITVAPTNVDFLSTATTTVCAIQSPAATSTLSKGGFQMTTSSTTASTVTMARATTAFATTTLIGSQIAIAAGGQSFAIASTTSTTGGSTVFPPSSWFVVGMQGNIGTFTPVGRCWAQFDTYGL